MKSPQHRWWQPLVSICILIGMVALLAWVLYVPWNRTQQALIDGTTQMGPLAIFVTPTATPTQMKTMPTPTASVTPDMPVKIYCEVTKTQVIDRRPKYDNFDYFIYATLLIRQNDLSYTRTGQIIRMQWLPTSTPIALGSLKDIHQGAVLQISGAMDPTLLLHVNQVAVLTGHVAVKPPTY
ncbi:hypothetical protein [Ktedonobacter racemifer]|uniref:Uncharacterized protein n=1 Tax=Ktedonobacter racemifer DSM 44963 TaxID=485913 RepID=D6U1J1_KTERA|nr:hypothetical protein [Ktedonobacter racemifer]EFH82635.1 hypothetical protein Krac_3468 [Ktedonobacter racemifer DSM 44963]